MDKDIQFFKRYYSELLKMVELGREIYLDELIKCIPLPESDLFNFIRVLQELNYELKACPPTGRRLLLPPPKTIDYSLFSPHELYFLHQLEKQVHGYGWEVSLVDGRRWKMIFRRAVYLDGIISAIGETLGKKSLFSLPLREIHTLKEWGEGNYKAHYSDPEIDEYLGAMKDMNGNMERLVLKIDAAALPDLSPPYHFFAHPFVTYNAEGGRIFGATVEISDPLVEWLLSLGSGVEILSSDRIKKSMIEYAENRIASTKRKASF